MGSDDALVREKAIISLKRVSGLLSKSSVSTVYLALIKRLKKGDVFSMRIAAS